MKTPSVLVVCCLVLIATLVMSPANLVRLKADATHGDDSAMSPAALDP